MAREEVEVKGWVNHRTLTSETMILITYAANSQPIFFFDEQYVISATRGFSIKTKQKTFIGCCVDAVEQSVGWKPLRSAA